MKRILKYLFAVSILSSFLLVACENDDDYTPIIGSGAEIEFATKPVVVGNSFDLLWYINENAASYTLEWSLDETFAPENTESVIIEDNTTVSRSVTDLFYSETYYVRLRANYENGTSSGWVTTQAVTADRIIPTVLQIFADGVYGVDVTMYWNPSYEVTDIELQRYDSETSTWGEPVTYTLTQADIDASMKKITNLANKTTYRATIYNYNDPYYPNYNYQDFTTYVYLAPGATIVGIGQNFNTALTEAQDGDNIFLAEGFVGALSATTITAKNISVTSDPDSYANIEVTTKGFSFQGDVENVSFSRIRFSSTVDRVPLIRPESTETTTVGTITFEDCMFEDILLCNLNSAAPITIDSLNFNNSIMFWTQLYASSADGIFTFQNATPQLKNLNITNSTMINIPGAVQRGNGSSFQTRMQFTFRNVTWAGLDRPAYNGTFRDGAIDIHLYNIIWSPINDVPAYTGGNQRPFVNNPVTKINTYYTSDQYTGANYRLDTNGGGKKIDISSSQIFVNPVLGSARNFRFTVGATYNGVLLRTVGIGDPRWYAEGVTPIPDDYVWPTP